MPLSGSRNVEEIGGNEGGNESGSKATQAKTKRAAVQLRRPLFRERLGRMERLRTTSAAVTGTTDQLWVSQERPMTVAIRRQKRTNERNAENEAEHAVLCFPRRRRARRLCFSEIKVST